MQLFEFLNELKSEFSMKDLGQVHYFLGIEILHNSDGLRNNLLFYVLLLKITCLLIYLMILGFLYLLRQRYVSTT